MKINHPAIYVFGAGASYGAFAEEEILPLILPPTDGDFFQVASQIRSRRTGILADRVLRHVHEQYQKTYGVSLETYYREIETRGEIGKIAPTQNKPKDWEGRQKELNELIRRVLIQTTCTQENNADTYKPLPSKILQKILGIVKAKDTVLTFNYDTLIEESLGKPSLWNPRDGYAVNAAGVRGNWYKNWRDEHEPDPKSGFKILKMHGSLNWEKAPRGIKLKQRPYVVRGRGKIPVSEKVLFLPPSYKKDVDRNPYKAIWQEARKGLENADSLIILGYSLPQNDFLAQALFAEAVRKRKSLGRYIKMVAIANPDKKVRDNFLALLQPAMGPLTQIATFDSVKDFSRRA